MADSSSAMRERYAELDFEVKAVLKILFDFSKNHVERGIAAVAALAKTRAEKLTAHHVLANVATDA